MECTKICLSLIDYNEACICRRIMIGISYDTVIEIITRVSILNFINKCECYIRRNLFKGCNHLVKNIIKHTRRKFRGIFYNFISIRIDEIDKICGGYTLLKCLCRSKSFFKPSGKINIYIAVKSINTNFAHTTGYIGITGNKNIIRGKTFNRRTCCYFGSITILIVGIFTTSNLNGRFGHINNYCANASTIVTHITIFIVFNVSGNNFIYTCMYGSFVGEICLTVSLEASIDK